MVQRPRKYFKHDVVKVREGRSFLIQWIQRMKQKHQLIKVYGGLTNVA